jgi:putative CocE/NonD family hydrolase
MTKLVLDSQPIYKIKMEIDVRVPMRDGIKLSTDIYRPDAKGKFPAILMRTAYHSTVPAYTEIGQFYTPRGYAVVIQDVRGRFDSEGKSWAPLKNDIKDGYDTLDWIGTQPWCNSKIGMIGGSYGGAVQWLVAPLGSPYLKCLIPASIGSDYWKHVYYVNGVFSLGLCMIWGLVQNGSRTHDRELTPLMDWSQVFRTLPYITADKALGLVNHQFWRDWIEHSTYDDYWKEISIDDKYDKIDVPCYIWDGWYDYYHGESCKIYKNLTTIAKTEKTRRSQKLIMGPWDHGYSLGQSKLGEVEFGVKSIVPVNEMKLRWFDHWLKGIDNGIMDEPPIRIFVMGINKWRNEKEWPLARTRFTKYYLHSRGRANSVFGDGSLNTEMPVEEPTDDYTYDPENPVPTIGGNQSLWKAVYPAGPYDQRPIERRDDVLVYTSTALDEDVEVTGPIVIKLHAASSAPDTDFVTRLIDVHPNETSINLTEGVIRARFREPSMWEVPRLIEPGRIYEYTIDLNVTSNVFKKGHKIRVDIMSSCFPLWDPNPNTGHRFGMDAEMQTANQTIYHSKDYPSHIILPIIPPKK